MGDKIVSATKVQGMVIVELGWISRMIETNALKSKERSVKVCLEIFLFKRFIS